MIIKFKPIFFKKIWGGSKINKLYNLYDSKIGECWGISGHKNYSNEIEEGAYKGKKLSEIYYQYKELFGNYPSENFPIIIKFIDAKEDLSIQVHPDHNYALQVENTYEKDEEWLILENQFENKIIYGHNAKTKNELLEKINDNEIISILNFYDVKMNDRIYVPAGTIHAINSGMFVLEVSQTSNSTFRIFDYLRRENGKYRSLEIEKGLNATKIPDNKFNYKNKGLYFVNYTINNSNKKNIADVYGDYITIISGNGKINNKNVKAGDFLMITSNDEYNVFGNIKYQLTRLK